MAGGGGGFGTRPWWLALLACGGAYWPLAFEPSAMTSRHLAGGGGGARAHFLHAPPPPQKAPVTEALADPPTGLVTGIEGAPNKKWVTNGPQNALIILRYVSRRQPPPPPPKTTKPPPPNWLSGSKHAKPLPTAPSHCPGVRPPPPVANELKCASLLQGAWPLGKAGGSIHAASRRSRIHADMSRLACIGECTGMH